MQTDRPLTIGGWLADREGVGFYRMKLPLDELGRRGHSVEYRGVLPWRPGKRPSHHVLVAQRISNEGPSVQWQAARGDVRRVFEVDDLLLDVDPSSERAFEFYARPDVRRRLLENMRSADAVTVSTDYLAEAIRADYGVTAPVFVLPNCLPKDVLDLPSVDQSGPMTCGWSGSDTHRADVMLLRRPLSRFLGRHPEVRLTLAGVDYRRELGVPQAEVRGWRSIWDDPAGYYAGLDWQVTLAPLVSHHFNRAKSALRALEAAARGAVVVASDVEPYSRFIEHGVDGFLVRRDHEWLEVLELLAEDAELRAKVGAAARAKAADWTIGKHTDKWINAYRGDA
jgi:glycosyltransferase involved in cell wall biosynthesis